MGNQGVALTYSSRGLEAAEIRLETAYPTVCTPSERKCFDDENLFQICLQSNEWRKKSQETAQWEKNIEQFKSFIETAIMNSTGEEKTFPAINHLSRFRSKTKFRDLIKRIKTFAEKRVKRRKSRREVGTIQDLQRSLRLCNLWWLSFRIVRQLCTSRVFEGLTRSQGNSET